MARAKALRNSLEQATICADNPQELMRLLTLATRQMDTFTQEVVSGNPSIASEMVRQASIDVSLSLASTLIAKRAAEKGIALTAEKVQRLAEYSLSESAAQATGRPVAFTGLRPDAFTGKAFVLQKRTVPPRCAVHVEKKDQETASLHPKGAIWGVFVSIRFFSNNEYSLFCSLLIHSQLNMAHPPSSISNLQSTIKNHKSTILPPRCIIVMEGELRKYGTNLSYRT